MMNGAKKSDSSIVPAKLANKAERSAAEPVEGDDGTKRNAELQSTVRTQSRKAVTQAQARIRGAVNRNKKEKLTALLHHVSIDVLRWAFFNLKKRAAPGVDGLTWADYAADLDRNLTDLHARIHSGAYRALPSRRQYIPKADGKQRPLGISMRPSYCTLFNSGWNGDTGRVGNPLPQSVICRVGDRDDVWQAKLPLLCCYEAPVDPVINHPHTDAVSFANLFDVECIGGKRRAGNVMLVADPTDHGDREASAS